VEIAAAMREFLEENGISRTADKVVSR